MDMNAEFLGGKLAGEHRTPINEEELATLGYRPELITQPFGEELSFCYAVPIDWTPTQAHQAITKLFPRKPGKRSV